MEKAGCDDDDVEQDREDDVMIGSPLSDGKMVIKLKIPKMAKEDKRVCLVCKKEFSSGKALGGHMRVHVHVQNPSFLKPSKKIKKITNNLDHHSQRKPYYLNSVNHEGVPICSQCGKTFPSMKSLFGHMRCHPERVWRGILPPPNAAVAHRSTHGDDHVVDLTKLLKRWPVTEKRGRRALKPAHYHDQEDYNLLEAVEDLMSLANGPNGGPPPSSSESDITKPQMKTEVIEGSNSNSLTNKDDKGKGVDQIEFDYGYESESDTLKVGSKHKNGYKMKSIEDSSNGDECKFKCTTCNKCFSSHHALGGHKSSHNKSKIIITSQDEYDNLFSNSKEIDFGFGFGIGVHQCKICGKVFATGQALGGHKRCHWTGVTGPTLEPQAPAASSQVTSTGEAASRSGSGKKVHDFDLNEMPTAAALMEDGIVNGYASSSYNSNMG